MQRGERKPKSEQTFGEWMAGKARWAQSMPKERKLPAPSSRQGLIPKSGWNNLVDGVLERGESIAQRDRDGSLTRVPRLRPKPGDAKVAASTNRRRRNRGNRRNNTEGADRAEAPNSDRAA